MFAELSSVLKELKEKGVNEGNWFRKDSEKISSIICEKEKKKGLFLKKSLSLRLKSSKNRKRERNSKMTINMVEKEKS